MSPSSFPAHGDHADTPNHPNRSSSGLTLVLPPLSALKAQKSKKKLKLTYEEPVKKTPRPLKLKPLKEVLSKLISQIKKKDDYAFFLHPVDLAQVPGYSDVVSRPMDLGTMSTKVDKGKYRSLEEFAVSTSRSSVWRLVLVPPYPRSPNMVSRVVTLLQRLPHAFPEAARVIEQTCILLSIKQSYGCVEFSVTDTENVSSLSKLGVLYRLAPLPDNSATARNLRRSGPSPVQASDLRLVTTNAKTFNPPGTIYHTEADRIEAFALEHISKAAATVIEYETDWNIEIEKDEDPVNVDDDDASGVAGTPVDRTRATPMDVDESRAGSPFPAQAGGKRVKGKRLPGPLSESIEADGGLPGAKDGLGAFPTCSDWAELMLALKLKGKRYKTKKERMRIEKSGPPLTAEGSLDYWEMEDPFTVFAPLVPDPLERPQLNALYPSLEPLDPSRTPLPGPVNIIPVDDIPEPLTLAASHSAFKHPGRTKPAKRRHWTIVRNAPSRGRARDATEEESAPAWSNAREPAAPDFGTFAILPSVLAEERRVRDMGAELGSEAKMFDALRQSCQPPVGGSSQGKSSQDVKTENYWEGKAAEAEAYIRDVVYGGVDGFAYVRSLAEFLTLSEPIERDGEPPTHAELAMPVAKWVEQHIVDPLTDGRYAVLCEAARILRELPPTPPPEPSSPVPQSIPMPTSSPSSDPIHHQLELSLRTYPAAARALQSLQAIARAQIDLPALIHTPDELFRAEDVWAGREYREKRRREMDEALARDPEKNAAAYLQWAIEEHREAEAGASASAAAPGSAGAGVNSAMVEDAGMLAFALEYAADEIARLARGKQPSEDGDVKPFAKVDPDGDVEMKAEDDVAVGAPVPNGATEGAESKDEPGGEGEEDPTLKKLRLNLLALAKRAPLDQIMKLPAELVPAHLRHIVPTADA